MIIDIVRSDGSFIRERFERKQFISLLFCIVSFIIFVFVQLRYWRNGGIYLLTEKANDAVSITGTIEEITEPSERINGFKYDHMYGADIIIDGQYYFAVTAGELQPGDQVTVLYLPQSKCVLEIHMITDEQQ